MHLPPFNSAEVLGSSGKIVCTVSSKSDDVSSIRILEACHLLTSILWRFFFKTVLTVKSKTDSVSSITILEACDLLGKTLIDVFYDIHLPPFNSKEIFLRLYSPSKVKVIV
jgi:hypothetical protein